MKAIVATLVDEAQRGNVQAAGEVIDRSLGRPSRPT